MRNLTLIIALALAFITGVLVGTQSATTMIVQEGGFDTADIRYICHETNNMSWHRVKSGERSYE